MVHLIGIPVLLVAGAVLDRLFFNKAKAAVTKDIAVVDQAALDAIKKI